MLQVSTWTRVLVSIILFFGVMIALPNALPGSVREKMPSWLPHNTVSLGLDLQGGSYILLEVELDDVMKDRLESTLGDIRRALRKAHIGYADLSTSGGTVSVRIIEADQFDAAVAALKDVNPTLSGAMFSVGGREYEVTQPGRGVIEHHDRGARGERQPGFLQKRIICRRGALTDARVRREPELLDVCGDQVGDAAVLDHDPLGKASGSRGVDYVSQAVGGKPRGRRQGLEQFLRPINRIGDVQNAP